MWEFIVSLFGGVVGIMTVLGLWYVIQAYVRFKSGCGHDRDLLEFMAHGCAGCKGPGSCGREVKEHHHELV